MRPLFILFVSLLPFQPLFAQTPDYFGTSAPSGRPAASPIPSPEAALPPEIAAARTRYDQEVKLATAPIKARYAQALEALKKVFGGKGDLTAALAAQQEIENLGLTHGALSPSPRQAKVIVWNQHNASHNNGGAKTLNLALITGDKEVWRQNGIQIPWQKDEDTKVEVSVPYVPTDKLRVEVPETVEGRGGLAEIEYWWDGRNCALKRPVTVSSVWGNSPRCGGGTLTDGITTSKNESSGYWSMVDKMPGWAEVSLGIGN